MALTGKQETWIWSLGQEEPLEKKMVTHSSILAWEIPWKLQYTGSQSVRHNLVTKTAMTKVQTAIWPWHLGNWDLFQCPKGKVIMNKFVFIYLYNLEISKILNERITCMYIRSTQHKIKPWLLLLSLRIISSVYR